MSRSARPSGGPGRRASAPPHRPKLGVRRVQELLGHFELPDLVLPHRVAPLGTAEDEYERVAPRHQVRESEPERLRWVSRLCGERASEQQGTEPAHWSPESPSYASPRARAPGTDRGCGACP